MIQTCKNMLWSTVKSHSTEEQTDTPYKSSIILKTTFHPIRIFTKTKPKQELPSSEDTDFLQHIADISLDFIVYIVDKNSLLNFRIVHRKILIINKMKI